MRVPVVWEGTQLGVFDSKEKADAALELAQLMSDISERCYYAGWLGGTEDVLWSTLNTGPRKWGTGSIRQKDIDQLKSLSEQAQGWVTYTDEGGRFVPIAEWLRRQGTGKRET